MTITFNIDQPMALQRISPRICCSFFQPTIFLKRYIKGTRLLSKPTNIELDDVLDNFTTELLQKRIDSWETRNKKYKSLPKSSKSFSLEKCSNTDIRKLNKIKLNEVFTHSLHECNDVATMKLVKECLEQNICPDQNILLQVLYICAQKGEVNMILDLQKLCFIEKVNFSSNFDFSLYEGHAIWIRGNVIKALDIFEKLYINNPFLRRHIRVLLKKLVEGVQNNSQAILIHIIKFSENIADKYKDYFPMLCIWEVCFLSEWFSDQHIALELLSKKRRLVEVLINRLPYIVTFSLKNHRTEVIYRLFEILLNFEMEEHYGLVAVALLDYQFLQGNLRSYSEIIKWCHCKDVKLPRIYNEKYLQLLLNNQEVKDYVHLRENKQIQYKFLF